MQISTQLRNFFSTLTVLTLMVAVAPSVQAETIAVTDIAGRTVMVKKDPQKVVLGEGRMIYSIALLDKDDPFKRIAGWKDDMKKYDPGAYRKYLKAFPHADKIPSFGSPYSDEWNIEAVIALGTDCLLYTSPSPRD